MVKGIDKEWEENLKNKISKKVDGIALAKIFKIALDMTNEQMNSHKSSVDL